ncbi:MAG TPA: class I SAM-dependent methyltransferase [Myxococcota bacterium]|nr:class I SAM-dependent methyltransferase [Myxococcota bacterium]
MAEHRMYSELAHWWPLLSPPAHYVEEAAFFRALLWRAKPRPRTLLELGCGGGSLAANLKRDFALTLADLSPQMLEVCRAQNPECEVLPGDMRTLRLGREFDAVLVHDAIMYATSESDLRATIATAALHCRAGGLVILAPDYTRESFGRFFSANENAGAERTPGGTECGGEDGADGRALRFLEWVWDPDPNDSTYEVAYTLTLREADGTTRAELDRHTEGLFPEAIWLQLMREAGLDATSVPDPWRGNIFVGAKR